jgi:hypothetical protein
MGYCGFALFGTIGSPSAQLYVVEKRELAES